ncbi:vibrio cholerae toxin co-regulated pilus biosynthesis F family protein [Vibrio cholerae HC-41A1]|nr:colonization factor TcpF [Vibrio cholerae]EHH99831.1 vibrio cholerae toxin co-regulated pilus biosynthesis F family protein [Vibrio cholerae HC-43A1]EJH34264.1 vibrio cholerae toxin co-regulated pilus biosynthesis F family protein [Vibrio cholerae CP1038(11)]EJH54235.1 vibrio cholerae toxin co-regulated pilus biosynthesis F family protein [Vibrio cholerae HC-20A2]EKG53541.1 vibrio cholerae toxin co-regulated pilus biosynthesis F family protein [Vibrio cholerae HC-41A1]EKL29996.1 vibrio chol
MLSIMITSFNSFAFNDNYSSTSTVYATSNEATDSRGSEHLRYPYLECIKIGMSRDYLENCVKVSFPTSQDMFYDAYPSTESDGAKTRTKEDFSARLLAGDYDSLQKLYIDFYLAQTTFDWEIPTRDQIETLVNYANEGKLSTALNQEYITGRFLTKENGRYDIVNVGGVPDNTPVKLPAIVSKRGLMGTTSVVNAIPNEIYPHIKVYEGTLSRLKPGGAMIAVLEYDVSELSKHGYTNLWDVQFKVLVGVPHAETGVIYDPVYEETVKPYQPSGNLTGKKLYNVSTNDMHNGYKWSNTMFSNSNYKTQILLTKGDGSGVKLYSKAYSENFK